MSKIETDKETEAWDGSRASIGGVDSIKTKLDSKLLEVDSKLVKVDS
ncbi:hypothetical protein [Neobacillus drentensis]